MTTTQNAVTIIRRARSPIEMMVDRACGFDPNNPPPAKPKPSDAEIQAAFTEVFDAALAWQKNYKKGATRLISAVKAAKAIGF